jgi:hypothetical protein
LKVHPFAGQHIRNFLELILGDIDVHRGPLLI